VVPINNKRYLFNFLDSNMGNPSGELKYANTTKAEAIPKKIVSNKAEITQTKLGKPSYPPKKKLVTRKKPSIDKDRNMQAII